MKLNVVQTMTFAVMLQVGVSQIALANEADQAQLGYDQLETYDDFAAAMELETSTSDEEETGSSFFESSTAEKINTDQDVDRGVKKMIVVQALKKGGPALAKLAKTLGLSDDAVFVLKKYGPELGDYLDGLVNDYALQPMADFLVGLGASHPTAYLIAKVICDFIL
jgi:hypothetical protein